MTAALTHGPNRRLPDAYVYAWDTLVYPIFHEGGGRHWHGPFAHEFDVSREMIEELSKFLDDRWLAKNVPTFYELEDRYDVRHGGGEWGRGTLIYACRYMYLNKPSFDEAFWNTIVAPGRHPSEAAGIVDDFDPQRDIYLL